MNTNEKTCGYVTSVEDICSMLVSDSSKMNSLS